MKSLLYLAYGSNLHPKRLAQRVPSARAIGTVSLSGWSLRFHKRGRDQSGKCNLVRTGCPEDIAHGAIYKMAAAERLHLDLAEGLGQGYEIAWLELASFGRVFLYQAAASHVDEHLVPYTWYRSLVLAGAAHHGFPSEYLASIETVGARRDPDPNRHQSHLEILSR